MANREIQLLFKVVDQATSQIKAIRAELEQLQRLQGAYQGAGAAAQQAGNAAGQAAQQASQQNNLLKQGVGGLAFAFNNVVQAVGLLKAAGGQAYDLLIGQNVRLQQQLLGTAATLASTNKVIQDGVEIKDPTAAIKALGPDIDAAVAKIRKGSESLVGVTSDQLIPIFQNIAGQSSSIGANLDDSAGLTLKFAAALGTLGVPLDQARQEVSSILMQSISSDSVLAKSLGITNEMVANFRSQGRLVEFLNGKLAAFSAGNALAANTVGGVSSNIQELIQEFGRLAGAPLLQPIVDGLNQVYGFLQDNRTAINEFATYFGAKLAQVGVAFGEAFGAIAEAIGPSFADAKSSGEVFFDIITGGFIALANTVKAIAPVVGGVVGIFTKITSTITAAVNQIRENYALVIGLASKIPGLKGLGDPIKDAGEALDIFTNASKTAIAQTDDITTKINQAKAAQKGQTDLTKDQITQNSKLAASARQQSGAIAAQISQLQQFVPITKKQREEQQAQIKVLRDRKKVLDESLQGFKAESGVKLASRDLENLGTEFEQLKKKAASFQAQIKNPANEDQFKAATKGLLEITQQELELGQISQEEAAQRIQSIQKDSRVELETKANARKIAAKIRQEAGDRDIEALKIQQEQIQANLEAGNGNELTLTKQLTDLKLEELRKRIAQQQEILKNSPEGSVDAKKAASQIKSLNAQLLKETVSGRKQVAEAEAKAIQIQQSEVQNAIASGATSELDGARRLTALREQEIQKRLSVTAKGSTEERRLQAELAKVAIDGRKQVAELEAKAIASQEGNIQNAIADGRTSEIQGEQLLTDLKRQEIEKRLSVVAKGSAEETQLRAELERSQIESLKRIQQIRLQEIERAEGRASDAIASAEVERQIQIQQLINAGRLRKEDAEAENLKLTRDRIGGELAAEKDKLAALEALPRGGTAAEQEEQENRIRDSKRRTAELTRDLLKNEEDQQQALTASIQREIDRRTAAQKNTFTEIQQSFEAQAQLLDVQSKALENQNRLLEERKNLSQALDSFTQNELKLIAEMTTSESKRKQIEEAAAKLRVQSLLRSQDLERQSLELELQKNQILLEQEKIRNRIAQTQNLAEVAQAEADIAKAQADKNTTPEQLRALQLALAARQQQGGALAQQGTLLEQQGAQEQATAENRRQVLLAQQATALDSANAEAIGAIASPRRRRREQREFQQQLLDRFGGRGQFEAGIKATNAGFDNAPTTAINPFLPIQGPIATLPTASPQGVQAAQGSAEAILKQQLEALKSAGTFNQENQLQIINQFTGADVNAGAVGKQTEDAGRKLFDSVLKKAEQGKLSRNVNFRG